MTDHVKVKDSSFLEESLSKIGKDVIKYSPSKILGMFTNLFLVPIYTGLLTPSEYGLYNIAIGVLSFICIIFSDWVGLAGLRFFKEHQNTNNIKSYFSTLLLLLVSNLGVMYLLGFLLFKSLSNFFKIPSDFLYLVLLLIIPVAIRALLFQILRAQIKPLTYTISVIINQFTTVIFAVYFITQWHLGSKAILIGMAFSIVLIDFVMLMQSKFSQSLELEAVKFNILDNFYKYGLPIAASSLGMWIITQSNKFVLQYFKGSYYNGLCGVGFNLTFSIILPLFSIITLAAIPRIFNEYESGGDVNPVITRLTEYYFILFTPIIFILCLYPKQIVTLFSAKEYSDAYILLPFLALSVFAFGLTEYTTIQYHLAKKTYIDTIIKLIPGFVGIILSIILIPSLNILGVGIATLSSHVLYLLFSLLVRIKGLNWVPPYRIILKTFNALIIALIAFFIFRGISTEINSTGFMLQTLSLILIYIFALKIQSGKSAII